MAVECEAAPAGSSSQDMQPDPVMAVECEASEQQVAAPGTGAGVVCDGATAAPSASGASGRTRATKLRDPGTAPGAFATCSYDDDDDCPDKLSPAEFGEVKRLGALGDGAYKACEFASARRHWDEALRVFADRAGCGVQVLIKSRLYSRQAGIALDVSQWASARTFASQALEVDEANTKARLRRVRALLELGGSEELSLASADIARIKADGGTLSKDTIDRFRELVLSAGS